MPAGRKPCAGCDRHRGDGEMRSGRGAFAEMRVVAVSPPLPLPPSPRAAGEWGWGEHAGQDLSIWEVCGRVWEGSRCALRQSRGLGSRARRPLQPRYFPALRLASRPYVQSRPGAPHGRTRARRQLRDGGGAGWGRSAERGRGSCRDHYPRVRGPAGESLGGMGLPAVAGQRGGGRKQGAGGGAGRK